MARQGKGHRAQLGKAPAEAAKRVESADLAPPFERPHRSKAPASWTHSKRFASQFTCSSPRSLKLPLSSTVEKPLVSVVLPCRNEVDCIEDCLASVLAQQAPEGGFEVIIADGMSEDGTREAIRKAEGRRQKVESDKTRAEGGNLKPESRGEKVERGAVSPKSKVQSPKSTDTSGPLIVMVIDNPGRIVSTGLNAAIRAARGDIIIRMDAHTEYAPDYIRRCVETLTRTGADNVGGPARTRAETFLERALAAAYHSPFSVGGARFHDTGYEGWVDTVTYGCWRRGAFERFGYFDEELVRNQDDEHNLRIVRGGGRVWQNPNIKSWYRPRGSLQALFQQYMQYGYWKVRVIQKHRLPASWRHLVPGAFVLGLLSLFLLSAFSFLLSVLAPLSSALAFVVNFSFQLSAFSSISLLLLYAFMVSVASIVTAAKTEWKLLPVLLPVFSCYHFGYGSGFLRSLWDGVMRRRHVGTRFVVVTRANEPAQ